MRATRLLISNRELHRRRHSLWNISNIILDSSENRWFIFDQELYIWEVFLYGTNKISQITSMSLTRFQKFRILLLWNNDNERIQRKKNASTNSVISKDHRFFVGAGFYKYDAQAKKQPDPYLEDIIYKLSQNAVKSTVIRSDKVNWKLWNKKMWLRKV